MGVTGEMPETGTQAKERGGAKDVGEKYKRSCPAEEPERVARSFPVETYEPRESAGWREAFGRFEALIGA